MRFDAKAALIMPLKAAWHGCSENAGISLHRPFAERLIGSIRRECVDHIIVPGEAHLCRILKWQGDFGGPSAEREGHSGCYCSGWRGAGGWFGDFRLASYQSHAKPHEIMAAMPRMPSTMRLEKSTALESARSAQLRPIAKMVTAVKMRAGLALIGLSFMTRARACSRKLGDVA